MEHNDEVYCLDFFQFFAAMLPQVGAFIGLYAWIWPAAFQAELAQPGNLALWLVGLGLPLSLFEYLYHRYLLHSAVLPFLGAMHHAHKTHHGLTYVKAPVRQDEPARLVEVKSEYPIEEEHQTESMKFPLWSHSLFEVTFLVLLGIPLKLIFPSQPIIFPLIVAVGLYISSYEIWHAILHLPFERFWEPGMKKRFWGKMVKNVYGFHLMHHWRPTSNLAIVGFWGLAIWDHAFLTHRRPEHMPLDGAQVNYLDAKLRKPLWPISLLDKWQAGLFKAARATEKFFARLFLRRKAAK